MLLIIYCLLTYCTLKKDTGDSTPSSDKQSGSSTPVTKKISNIVKRSVSRLESMKKKSKPTTPLQKIKKADSVSSVAGYGSTPDIYKSGLQTPTEKRGFFRKPKKYPSFIGSMDTIGLEESQDGNSKIINSAYSTADLTFIGLIDSKDSDDSEPSSKKNTQIKRNSRVSQPSPNISGSAPKIYATHLKRSSGYFTPTTPMSMSLLNVNEESHFETGETSGERLYSKLQRNNIESESKTSEEESEVIEIKDKIKHDLDAEEPGKDSLKDDKLENPAEDENLNESEVINSSFSEECEKDVPEDASSVSFIKSLRANQDTPSPKASGIPKVMRRKNKANDLMKKLSNDNLLGGVEDKEIEEKESSVDVNDEFVFQYIPRHVSIPLTSDQKDKYKAKFFDAVNLFNTTPEILNPFKLLVYEYQKYCNENLGQEVKTKETKIGFNTLFLSRRNNITFALMKLSECEDLEMIYEKVHSGDKKMHFNEQIITYLKQCSGKNDNGGLTFTINLKTKSHELSLLDLAIYFIAKYCCENL